MVRLRKKILILIGDLVLAANLVWVTAVVTDVSSPVVPTALLVGLPVAFYVAGLYELTPGGFRIRPLLQVAVACGILAVGLALFDLAFDSVVVPRRFMVAALVSITALMVPWRILLDRLERRLDHLRVPVVILGERGSEELRTLLSGHALFDLRAIVPGPLDPETQDGVLSPLVAQWNRDIAVLRAAAPTIVVTDPDSVQPRGYAKLLELRRMGFRVQALPEFWEEATGRLPVAYLTDEWIALYSGIQIDRGLTSRLKRTIDLTGATLLLLVLAAPTLLAALALFISDPGPPFFVQTRVGRNATRFRVYKLRTMRRDRSGTGAAWTVKDDPRVTAVGRLVRRFRLDEVPQLINVIRGDMSLVGPRPEEESLGTLYSDSIPYYELRLLATPGLTGWAQVCLGNTSSIEGARQKLEFDLYYIHRMGPMLDFRIILKTIYVVLFGRD